MKMKKKLYPGWVGTSLVNVMAKNMSYVKNFSSVFCLFILFFLFLTCNQQKRKSALFRILHKIYNIFSEFAIQWNVSENVLPSQNISLVQVNNCWFNTDYVRFIIRGLVTFKRCWFTESKVTLLLYFSILPSINEFKPTAELLSEFHFYASNHKIQLIQCNFTGKSYKGVVIFNVYEVFREILLRQCNFCLLDASLIVGDQTIQNCVSAMVYQVENSTFNETVHRVSGHSPSSFAFIRFNHVMFISSFLIQYDRGGYVGFYLYNSSFSKIDSGAIVAVQTIYINISHCVFRLTESPSCAYGGCFVHAEGRALSSIKSKSVRNLFFPTCTTSPISLCFKVEVHNSQFIGSPVRNTFIINTSCVNLILNKCQFSTQNQKRLFSGAALVQSLMPYIVVGRETTFDVSVSVADNHNPIVVIKQPYYIKFFTSHILCPKTYKTFEILNRDLALYSCKLACEIDEYTHEGGNGTFILNKNNTSLVLNMERPTCNPCPVGGKCEGSIKPIPNYWGYKSKSNHVTMIRCPDGYCCQNNYTWQGISSCAELRTGTLCGSCIENFTESLTLPNCVKSEKCFFELILIIYFLASLCYAVGTITINGIKRKVLELLKNLYRFIRKKSLKKEQTGKMTEVKKKDNKEEDAMKYLQILFYYVQDAELFKVKIPNDYQEGESMLIKVFQRSPEIVFALYTKVSELCFISTATAITKMWFKLMFGPCVMVFLFCFFVGQLILSKFKFTKERHLKSMRSCLTRAFLLVYLFTYQ